MGTYIVGVDDIIEALDETLDNIEGDFTEKQLFDALKIMKLYPFVSDKKKSVPNYVRARRKNEYNK